MYKLIQEISWAVRRIIRRPVSATGIVITLTLGIGITVGMFSVLHGVVLQALPYPDAGRLVIIHSANAERDVPRGLLTPAEAIEGLVDVPGFDRAAYFHWGAVTQDVDGSPRNITALHVSDDYFSVFGAPAALGRTLGAADIAEQRQVMVLSHAAWVSIAAGDEQALGQTFTFRDRQFELVGVMPPEFAHPAAGQVVYLPINPVALAANPATYPNARYMNALGRLAVRGEQGLAAEGLGARNAAVREAHALADQGWRISYSSMLDDAVGDVRRTLYALFAVAAFVLLIACTNTASLVSIRLEQRQAELAVRRALGASGARVAADVITELCILAALAAVGGLLLAHSMIEVLKPLAAGSLPRASSIEVDGAVLGFAVVAVLFSILLSGSGPLLRALRVRPAENLRGGTGRDVRGSARVAWLPVAGIGLSTLALVAALALTTSLVRLNAVEPGFRTDGIAALQFFRNNPSEVPQFVERAAEALGALPGVQEVAAVSAPPLSVVGSMNIDVLVRGRDQVEPIQAVSRRATADYHRFIGTPMRAGRDIGIHDVDGSPAVAVINETLARRVFGDTDPVGEVLLLPLGTSERVPVEVVGVAADTRNAGLRSLTEPEVVVAMAQLPMNAVTLMVDSSVVPPNWLRTLRETLQTVDAQQAVFRSFTMESELDRQLQGARFFATATGWFAVFALLLGAAGINAVVAAMQRRRTREIGLRMALGASPREAARLVYINTLTMVGLGVAFAAIAMLPAINWMQGQLFGVGAATLGVIFSVACLVLVVAAGSAAVFPAWRAARVAPMEALRYE